MARKLQKTLADYIVVAISPALIMALVMSLVFFLVEVSYGGNFGGRLRWILFWFVFAAVLTARIGIEQGRAYAAGYTLAMALAAGLVVMQYVDALLLSWGLMGVVWWCTSKLTWDCTLIDEDEDASGEGLLQVVGLDKAASDAGSSQESRDTAAPSPAEPPAPNQEEEQSAPLWERLFLNRSERKGRAHSPGLWVVYFSFAALPLFGLGQVLMDNEDAAGRRWGFTLLWIYVASALGLLLTTSFLGLRRYLRQRKLRMPASMAATWLGTGAALIVAIMLLSMLLPRPQANYSLAGAIDKIGSVAQQASDRVLLRRDAGEGQGASSSDQKDEEDDAEGGDGPPDRDGKGPPKPSDNGKGDTPSNSGAKKKGGGGSGKEGKPQQDRGKASDSRSTPRDQKTDGGKSQSNKSSQQSDNKGEKGEPSKDPEDKVAQGDRNQDDQKKDDERRGAAPNNHPDAKNQGGSSRKGSSQNRSLPQVSQWVGSGVKWLIYGLLAVGVLFLFLRYREAVLRFLGQLWMELQKLLNDLFGRKGDQTRRQTSDEEQDIAARRRPFADYANPFSTGAASRLSPAALLAYTFEALEAWADDHGNRRDPEDTPHEFARSLGRRFPDLKPDVHQVTQAYAQMAYGNRAPSESCRDDLQRLWMRLGGTM